MSRKVHHMARTLFTPLTPAGSAPSGSVTSGRLPSLIRGILCLGLTLSLWGCVDMRSFEGQWSGTIVAEEALRQGFTVNTEVELLQLDQVNLQQITATLTTSDGQFRATPLTRMEKFSYDVLSSLTFDGNPLRTYLLFAPPAAAPGGELAYCFISLFGDNHVELRVLQGNALFGLFNLYRKE